MKKQFIDKLAYIHLKDEKILITLSREIKEELSVDIVPDTIKHYGTFEAQAHGKPLGTVVRMTCYIADYQGELKPDAEIEKVDFFTYSQKPITSPVDHLIFDDLYAKG